MRAMTKFDISNNGLRPKGTKLLAAALKGNQVVTGLNISRNNMTYNFRKYAGMSGVIALADVISDMGALSSLNPASNSIGGYLKSGQFSATPEGRVSCSFVRAAGNY
jgi:hypothetical protein